MAKREILSAAEHFSQIRACRKNNLNGSMAPGPPTNVPGQVTIQVRVPYRVVGLVVGPKGATIKRIQQQTHTYIVTPSRDKEPVFEVTGLPESVEQAKKEIEAHIAMRTGGLLDQEDPLSALQNRTDLSNTQVMESLFQPPPQELVTSLYKMNNQTINGMTSLNGLSNGALNGLSNGINGTSSISGLNNMNNSLTSNGLMNGLNSINSLNQLNDISSFSLLGETGSSLLGGKTGLDTQIFSNMNGNSSKITDLNNQGFSGIYNGVDEGLGSIGSSMGSSPSFEPNQTSIWGDIGRSLGTSLGSTISSSSSLSSTFSSLSSTLSSSLTRRSSSVSGASPPSSRLSPSLEAHAPARRISSDPAPALGGSSSLASLTSALTGGGLGGLQSSPSNTSPSSSTPDLPLSSIANFGSTVGNGTICTSTATTTCPTSGMLSLDPRSEKRCRVCCESEVVAALVPCGHNLFCMDCATKLVSETANCPICHVKVTQAIRIFS